MKHYLLLTLVVVLGILAIVGWQQAYFLRSDFSQRLSLIQDYQTQVLKQEEVISDLSKILADTREKLAYEEKEKSYAQTMAMMYSNLWEQEKAAIEATPEELVRAYQIIKLGVSSHLYYVNNPDKQTLETGGTIFNWGWADNYWFLESLIDRAYKVGKQ